MNSSGMGVIPPGGTFKFAQRLPNGNFWHIQALTEEQLVKEVTNYRAINNIPIGDVKEEVSAQLKGKIPKLSESRSLRERVTNWKVNRTLNKIDFTTQEEAEERAAICTDCHFNQKDYADSCKECYQGTTRDLYAMRQGRTTSSDPWLGACEIVGQHNVTAVHLDDDSLRYRVNFIQELKDKYPKCWLLALNKAKEVDS